MLLLRLILLFIAVSQSSYLLSNETEKLPAANNNEIEEVIVKAKKLPGAKFHIQSTTTNYDQEAINEIQPNSVFDVLKNIPGIELGGGPRANGINLNVRGFSDQEDVLVIVDGALKNFQKYRFGSMTIEPELLKKIDVSRGPSSVVQGSGAIGGVIEMETKDASDFLKADDNWGGFVKLGYNNNNSDKLRIASLYAKPVDSIDLLISKTRRDSNNILLSSGDRLPLSDSSPESSLAKAEWQIKDFIAGLSYSQTKSQGREFFDTATFDSSVNGEVLRDSIDNTYASNLFYQPVNPLIDLHLSIAYTDTSINEQEIDMESNNLTQRIWNFVYDIWNVRLINEADFSLNNHYFNLQSGLQFSEENRQTNLLDRSGNISDSVLSQPSGINTNSALFNQLRWQWQAWDLTLGYRWDKNSVEVTQAESLALLRQHQQANKFSEKTGLLNYRLSYEFADRNLSIFHSYVEAARYPKIDEYFIANNFGRCYANQSEGEKLRHDLKTKQINIQQLLTEIDSNANTNIEELNKLIANNTVEAEQRITAANRLYENYRLSINSYIDSINNDTTLSNALKTSQINQAYGWLNDAAVNRDTLILTINTALESNIAIWREQIARIANQSARDQDQLLQALKDQFVATGLEDIIDLDTVNIPSASILPEPYRSSEVCGDLYQPELAYNKEWGINFRPENILVNYDALSIKLVYFETEVKNILESLNTNPSNPASQPGKESKHGYELETSYLIDKWRFDFNYNRIRATSSRYRKAINPNSSNDFDHYISQYQTVKDRNAPADRLSVTARWINDLETLQLGASLIHKFSRLAYEFDSQAGEQLRQQHATNTINMFAKWQPQEDLQLNFTIDNLTNEQYRVPSGFDSGSGKIYLGNFNTGRSIRASLTYNF